MSTPITLPFSWTLTAIYSFFLYKTTTAKIHIHHTTLLLTDILLYLPDAILCLQGYMLQSAFPQNLS